MRTCARCDWTAVVDDLTAEEQAVQHAQDSGHWLCPCCGQSLAEHDGAQGCEKCLTRVREHLAGINLLFAELPTHLGHVRSPAYDSDRPSTADGRPLPGGDVLVLLGPGAAGNVSRFGDDYEPDPKIAPERWWPLGQVGPLPLARYLAAERRRYGTEHVIDNRDTDAPSIAWSLESWERDWREWRDDLLDNTPRSVGAAIRSAAAYLEIHARWAANSHDAFPEFAEDMRQLHARLERATGRSERKFVAEAECFDCGGDLVREITDKGYSDDFTCQRCGAVYDWPRYVLALRGKLETDTGGWVPVDVAAERLEIPADTIRKWIRRGHVSAVCTAVQGVKDKHWRVHPDEVATHAGKRRAS